MMIDCKYKKNLLLSLTACVETLCLAFLQHVVRSDSVFQETVQLQHIYSIPCKQSYLSAAILSINLDVCTAPANVYI